MLDTFAVKKHPHKKIVGCCVSLGGKNGCKLANAQVSKVNIVAAEQATVCLIILLDFNMYVGNCGITSKYGHLNSLLKLFSNRI